MSPTARETHTHTIFGVEFQQTCVTSVCLLTAATYVFAHPSLCWTPARADWKTKTVRFLIERAVTAKDIQVQGRWLRRGSDAEVAYRARGQRWMDAMAWARGRKYVNGYCVLSDGGE